MNSFCLTLVFLLILSLSAVAYHVSAVVVFIQSDWTNPTFSERNFTMVTAMKPVGSKWYSFTSNVPVNGWVLIETAQISLTCSSSDASDANCYFNCLSGVSCDSTNERPQSVPFESIGCIYDRSSIDIPASSQQSPLVNRWTVEGCVRQSASLGKIYALMRNSGECFSTNNLLTPSQSEVASSSSCVTTCVDGLFCGGSASSRYFSAYFLNSSSHSYTVGATDRSVVTQNSGLTSVNADVGDRAQTNGYITSVSIAFCAGLNSSPQLSFIVLAQSSTNAASFQFRSRVQKTVTITNTLSGYQSISLNDTPLYIRAGERLAIYLPPSSAEFCRASASTKYYYMQGEYLSPSFSSFTRSNALLVFKISYRYTISTQPNYAAIGDFIASSIIASIVINNPSPFIYQIDAPAFVTALSVSVVARDPSRSIVEFDGVSSPQNIPLNWNPSVVIIRLTGQDQLLKRFYTVVIYKHPALLLNAVFQKDADSSILPLNMPFSPLNFSYSLTVNYIVNAIALTVTEPIPSISPLEIKCQMGVGGSFIALTNNVRSSSIPLAIGDNVLFLQVAFRDKSGKTVMEGNRTYTFFIQRLPALLSLNLRSNSDTFPLSQSIQPSIFLYSALFPATIVQRSLSVVVAEVSAASSIRWCVTNFTTTFNSSNVYSCNPISISRELILDDNNVVKITVSANNNPKLFTEYMIVINKYPALASLVINQVYNGAGIFPSVSMPFTSSTTLYSNPVSVDPLSKEIVVNALDYDAENSINVITVRRSSAVYRLAENVALPLGQSQITVRIENTLSGLSTNYQIILIRPTIAALAFFTTSPPGIFSFDSSITFYSSMVFFSNSSIRFTAIPFDPDSTLSLSYFINGKTEMVSVSSGVPSPSYTLPRVGDLRVDIQVTVASINQQRVYTFHMQRKPMLSSITIRENGESVVFPSLSLPFNFSNYDSVSDALRLSQPIVVGSRTTFVTIDASIADYGSPYPNVVYAAKGNSAYSLLAPIYLYYGVNTMVVRVMRTSSPSYSMGYIMDVYRAYTADLIELSSDPPGLFNFSQSILDYSVFVPYRLHLISFFATSYDPLAQLWMNIIPADTPNTEFPKRMNNGYRSPYIFLPELASTLVTITVISSENVVRANYTIKVNKLFGLSSVTFNSSSLQFPIDFRPTINSYSIITDVDHSSFTVASVGLPESAVLQKFCCLFQSESEFGNSCNKVCQSGKLFNLTVGTNVFKIAAQYGPGALYYYTFTIIRHGSSSLSSIDVVTIEPESIPAPIPLSNVSYSLTLPWTRSSFKLHTTSVDETAFVQIRIDGSIVGSSFLAKDGISSSISTTNLSKIELVVTTRASATTTTTAYTIFIDRIVTLTDLILRDATDSSVIPVWFSPSIRFVALTFPYSFSLFSITPVLENSPPLAYRLGDSDLIFLDNNIGPFTFGISVGTTTVSIYQITPDPNRSLLIFSISLFRQASVTLRDLQIIDEGVSLFPSFTATETSYRVPVTISRASISLKLIAVDSADHYLISRNDQLLVQGDFSSLQNAITFEIDGMTVAEIVVTLRNPVDPSAENRYIVRVIRGSPLIELSVTDAATQTIFPFSSSLATNIFRYQANVPGDTESVKISSALMYQDESISSLYRITSNDGSSSEWQSIPLDAQILVSLHYGHNTVEMYSATHHGEVLPLYSIIINRVAPALLSEIILLTIEYGPKVEPAPLPSFSPEIFHYSIDFPFFAPVVVVQGKSHNDICNIEYSADDEHHPDIFLKFLAVGVNRFTLTCAIDGGDTTNYYLHITRAPALSSIIIDTLSSEYDESLTVNVTSSIDWIRLFSDEEYRSSISTIYDLSDRPLHYETEIISLTLIQRIKEYLQSPFQTLSVRDDSPASASWLIQNALGTSEPQQIAIGQPSLPIPLSQGLNVINITLSIGTSYTAYSFILNRIATIDE